MASTHTCPGGCGRQIGDHLLACPYHWHQVPRDVANEVYRTYRQRQRFPGDEAKVAAHRAAMRAAIRHMSGATGRAATSRCVVAP